MMPRVEDVSIAFSLNEANERLGVSLGNFSPRQHILTVEGGMAKGFV